MPTAVTTLNCVNFKGHLLFARVDICMTKVCAEKNRNFGLKYVEILEQQSKLKAVRMWAKISLSWPRKSQLFCGGTA